MMKKPLFTGACTALVTPFLGDDLNLPMLDRLLARQWEAGISAVVLGGTTGEAPTLSDQEKLTLFRRGKAALEGRGLLIAGTGSNSTAHAIVLSRAAEEAGADALLVVSPYYNKATPDGIVAHYASIAAAVSIPVIVYNVPGRTGLDIPVSVYRQLARIPNIAGVKEASSDVTKVTRIRAACGDGFAVWTGCDELTVPAMALGAAGVISVASNIRPEEVAAMADAVLDGDLDTAAALQAALQPLNELLFCEVNPIPVKEMLTAMGWDCGGCRLPLCPPTEEHRQQIHAFLKSR